MKFNDLDIYNKYLNKKIKRAINTTIKENNFIFGNSVVKLESYLSKFVGCQNTITVGSGTDALFLSLMSLNLKPGDQVIIPSFSWLSVMEVVLLLNLKPIFVDTDINSFNLDISKIERLITNRTKVIISTSLFGRSVDLKKLKSITRKKKLALIEDAAQNFGSNIGNKSACNIADISCTSFFPTKNLGCFGDGGAIFTNNKKIAQKIKMLRNHGQKTYNNTNFVGLNSRLGSIQASILLEKLKELKKKKILQKNTYNRYSKFFSSKNIKGFPECRFSSKYYDDMNSHFSIIVKRRKLFIDYLKKYKLEYKIYYSKPLYKQFNYKKKIKLLNTEFICKNIISLPFNEFSKTRFNKTLNLLAKIIDKDKGIFFEKK